jgi:hypothetical protein
MDVPKSNPIPSQPIDKLMAEKRRAQMQHGTHLPAEAVAKLDQSVSDGRLSVSSAEAMLWAFRSYPKSLKKLSE